MKKYLITKMLLLLVLFIWETQSAQTSTENYIHSRKCLGEDCSKKLETITYYDGLGRAKQRVDVKASPGGKDVVTVFEYDGFGRQAKDFLPVPQSNTLSGEIISNPLANSTSIYGSERIFAEAKFEDSPLERLQEQTKVGSDWTNKPIKYEYSANSANDIRKYVTITTSIEGITNSTIKVADDSDSQNGFYKESNIYKRKATDEDGNIVYEFTNGNGNLLLTRRVLNSNENADTYYVYNEFAQLAYIIPPKASEAIKSLSAGTPIPGEVLNNLCYQYRLDGRDRLAEKKLPGKGWEYYVYDKQDRLVLTQDAVLRTASNNFGKRGWLFTKYDELGRIVYTGFFDNSESRSSMQTHLNNMILNPGNNETKTTIPLNSNGMDVYYTKSAFPTGSMTILSINYYDTYPEEAQATPTKILGQSVLKENLDADNESSTNGLLTASFLKNIENDRWTKTFTYYNTSGKIIGTRSLNHLGGYTNKEILLDYTGELTKKSITYHKRLDTDNESVIIETFEYDNGNRLVNHKHQVDNNPVEILAQNEYNELSQIRNKKIGGTDTSTPIQSIDYSYNIQGWLNKVNNPQSLGNKLFAYEIKFTNPVNTNLSSSYFNGNIAEIDWIAAGNNTLKRYSYKYDAMGRLKSGIYSEPNASIPENNYYNEVLTYDLNGNVTALKRNRNAEYIGVQLMDDLNYSYIGNRLNTVTDESGNYNGYPDTSGNVISYDDNGNMKDHLDKGMLQINYNYLNLPNYIKFNQFVITRLGETYVNTNYLYRADGIKLKKQYKYFVGRAQRGVTAVTDYLDGFQYSDDPLGTSIATDGTPMSLQFIPTDEGYFDFKQNKYFYQYKDQVGNVRLTYYKDDSGNAAIDRATDFYPFGLEFGGVGLNTSSSSSPNYLYSFQEQEKQQETGWSSFKWRNYDPSYVRFFNIDPLAEKYAYQSPFNFSENAVVAHRELEGLEKQHVFYTPFGTVVYTTGPAGSTSSGNLYETVKTNAKNNYNALVKFAGYNYKLLSAGGTLGIGLAASVLNSEGDNKAEASKTKSGKTQKETGSYTNTHKSGKKYHGKGDKERAAKSGKDKAKENDDPLESTEWTKAENDREAFKQESERMETDADKEKGTEGHENENNYNKRRSPGDRYRREDASKEQNNN